MPLEKLKKYKLAYDPICKEKQYSFQSGAVFTIITTKDLEAQPQYEVGLTEKDTYFPVDEVQRVAFKTDAGKVTRLPHNSQSRMNKFTPSLEIDTPSMGSVRLHSFHSLWSGDHL
jgi:hypothetical protein